MPNPEAIVMLLAAGLGLYAAWVVLWVLAVAFLNWLHGGAEFAEKNYPLEELERLRKFGL